MGTKSGLERLSIHDATRWLEADLLLSAITFYPSVLYVGACLHNAASISSLNPGILFGLH